jgi:hypothetical protein
MSAPKPSDLDPNQILQRLFDIETGRLRTDTTVSVEPGTTELVIDHGDDSIKLGDGTNLVTTTQSGSKVGLDVSIVNDSPVTVPFVYNVNVPLANFTVTIQIPSNTKILHIKARLGSLRISYEDGGAYFTINKGSNYTADGINAVNTSLYIQSSVAGDILEVHGWANS